MENCITMYNPNSIFDSYNRYNKLIQKYLLINLYNQYINYWINMKVTYKIKQKKSRERILKEKFVNPRFNDHCQKRSKKRMR